MPISAEPPDVLPASAFGGGNAEPPDVLPASTFEPPDVLTPKQLRLSPSGRFPLHGTAEEYGQHKPLFHMKSAVRETVGRDLTPEEETRIEDRYSSSIGNPTARQFTEQQAIEHSGSRADSLPRAIARGAYHGLTAPIAAFDPQEAELIRHEANVAVPVAPSTKTQIGEIAGGLAPVTAAAVTGNPEAVPMFLAAHGATSGVGTARTEAMQQREAGKPVSVAQETKAALGDAAIGGAGGYAAGTVLGATEAIPSMAGRIGANVGVNATMGAGQQAGREPGCATDHRPQSEDRAGRGARGSRGRGARLGVQRCRRSGKGCRARAVPTGTTGARDSAPRRPAAAARSRSRQIASQERIAAYREAFLKSTRRTDSTKPSEKQLRHFLKLRNRPTFCADLLR
jgi:hypothetical protein